MTPYIKITSILVVLFFSATTAFTGNAEEVDPIQSMISSLSEWAPTCDGSISKQDCQDESSALWNGLICASNQQNYTRACNAMRESQGPDGRMWRSPRRVGVEAKNSFSRYMGLGVLFYLVATKDQALATQWMDYIGKEGGLCPDGAFSSCIINGRFSDALRDVYQFIGLGYLLPASISNQPKNTLGWVFEAQTTALGEPLHYLALQLLLRKKMGDWTGEMKSAARVLNNRQTQNLLFLYLADGKTYDLCNRVLGLAPVTQPETVDQWTWESPDRDRTWRQSMGWDFILLGEACM